MGVGLVRNPAELARRQRARTFGRPPSVYLGRVPAERHEHYSADDQLTGYTLVIREPEWTDLDRQMIEELDAYERDVHACGHHKSVIHDPESGFEPKVDKCPVCAGVAVYSRVLQAEDEAARKKRGEKAPPTAPLPSDGRSWYMRMLTPAEAAERKAAAAAAPPLKPT